MDLNQKYAEHQLAVMLAAAATSPVSRKRHLEEAADIAGQIGDFQSRLGAAASCAWSARGLGSPAIENVVDQKFGS